MPFFSDHHDGVLSNEDNYEPDSVDENRVKKTFIRNTKVDYSHLAMLGSAVICFLVLAAFVFWDLFILNITHVCTSEFDCFLAPYTEDARDLLDNTTNATWFHNRETNCSQWENIDDGIGFNCYQLQFNLAIASAAVGGFFIATKAVAKISKLMLLIHENDNKCITCCFRFLHIIITFLLLGAEWVYISFALLAIARADTYRLTTRIKQINDWILYHEAVYFKLIAEALLMFSMINTLLIFPWKKYAHCRNQTDADAPNEPNDTGLVQNRDARNTHSVTYTKL